MGTGQEDRLGPFHPCHHPGDRAGLGGVLTTAPPQAWPLSRPAQSPNSARSSTGSPALAPAQLCSWPPPAAPAAGPQASAGAADTTTQLKLGLEPEARAGLGRQAVLEVRGGKAGGRGLWLRRAQVFSSWDSHHQGLCFLPQTHTHTDVHHTHIKAPEHCPCGSTETKETGPEYCLCVKSSGALSL